MTDEIWTLLGSSENRELWLRKKRQPDGEWAAFFTGKTFMMIEGTRKQTPDEPIFKDEETGCAWLASETNTPLIE